MANDLAESFKGQSLRQTCLEIAKEAANHGISFGQILKALFSLSTLDRFIWCKSLETSLSSIDSNFGEGSDE